ncbi:MAG: stage II sporulation protein P [Clostridia bacterium]|nr:stage II sporulation protein P [Clostridia bacterium]
MKKVCAILVVFIMLWASSAQADAYEVWEIVGETGEVLTIIGDEPAVGDQYISGENRLYEIVSIMKGRAVAADRGSVALPSLDWMDADSALPVSAMTRRIALYCTHSDESYEPSDGYYSTNDRGTIYEVAQSLADHLSEGGTEAVVSDAMHHPHDAGAYRRSRQTAVQLLRENAPDCILDIHRDGIPDPESYAVTLGGKQASKVRILVGRGNQNAEVNKEFALLVKAVGDRVYPGLIKDIYMGKGTFNQDLLPRSILLECGTYTLEKERVLTSMPLMADVLKRALYGGVVGSAGRTMSDVNDAPLQSSGGVTQGEPDAAAQTEETGNGVSSGLLFVIGILVVGLIGYGILSAGSVKGGMRKAGRNLNEMTGGLIGKKPEDGEDHKHS